MNVTPYAIPGTIIAHSVEEFFNFPEGTIFQRCRDREVVMARQIAIWLDHMEYKEKYSTNGWSCIARAYNYSHATIMHSVKTVQNDMHMRPYLKVVNNIQKNIYGEVRYPHPKKEDQPLQIA